MADQVRFQRAPGWVWRRTRGSVLVMGPDRAAHQLDGAAALAWLALQEPGSVADVLERALEHVAPGEGPDRAELGTWVVEAVDALLEQAMVVVCSDGDTAVPDSGVGR